ncbi:MAG: F0F1 ATP synthase subunit B [Corynebacterium sp.]|nr:F0F1 ATP synthase subunit B [Corynebacterium sp.]
MTTLYLAAGESNLPLQGEFNALLPTPYDMVWSLVCFIVVVIVFWKFVLPLFRNVLAEREDRIKGGIQRAEAAQAEANEAKQRYEQQLAEAHGEGSVIREKAREEAKRFKADKEAEALAESNRIIEAGEKQLAAQREQVVAELRREMGQHSIDLAERLIGEQLSDDVKRSGTIDAFLDQLDKVKPAGK